MFTFCLDIGARVVGQFEMKSIAQTVSPVTTKATAAALAARPQRGRGSDNALMDTTAAMIQAAAGTAATINSGTE